MIVLSLAYDYYFVSNVKLLNVCNNLGNVIHSSNIYENRSSLTPVDD